MSLFFVHQELSLILLKKKLDKAENYRQFYWQIIQKLPLFLLIKSCRLILSIRISQSRKLAQTFPRWILANLFDTRELFQNRSFERIISICTVISKQIKENRQKRKKKIEEISRKSMRTKETTTEENWEKSKKIEENQGKWKNKLPIENCVCFLIIIAIQID